MAATSVAYIKRPSRLRWPRSPKLAFTAVAGIVAGAVYSAVWAPLAVAAFVVTAFLVWRAALSSAELVTSPLLWPVLAFGAIVGGQWTFGLTVYRGATLTGLCQLAAAGAVFYLAVVAFRDSSNVRRFGTLCWVLAGGLAALAIAEAFTDGKKIYWYHNAAYATPVGPFVYHNHFAGAMDLLLPVALVVAFRRDRTGDSPWIGWLRRGIVPALAFVSVVLSLSRGGMITLAGEGLVAALLLSRVSRRYLFPLVIGAAVFLAFGVMIDWSPLLARFITLGHRDPSWLQRLQVGRACLHIFRDHLWLGSGFNTFASVYPRYQSFDNGLIWEQAHNEYAQMLAETGIAGTACVIAFVVLFLRTAWRRRAAQGLTARVQTAAIVGCAGLLFHSFGDFEFHAPAIAFLFFVTAAAATAPRDQVMRHRRVLIRSRRQPSDIDSGVVVRTELTPLRHE
jgi:O-antigen ligase